jgi:hypothetical protein
LPENFKEPASVGGRLALFCGEALPAKKAGGRSISNAHGIEAAARFLGTAGFFSGFVPSFATLAAPLHDMTAKSFSGTSRN